MKRILILGAGLVSRPMVRYLLKLDDVELTVATRTVSKALELIGGHPRGRAVELLADDESNLHHLIANCDIVVSLLPYTYHPAVARHCIALKKHLVTTSYVSDAMKAFESEARRAGILLLNEIGLDPGIDHMSAMALIDRIKTNGGRIISFISSCGGLPAPDANDNPLGYKFSWSPRGVLMAGRNDARFLQDGREILIPASQLFASCWRQLIPGFGELEAYPNRNSLPYIELYRLEGIRTMIRATLRYPGWCETMQAISELGLLRDERVRNDLNQLTYAQWFREYVPGTGSLQKDIAVRLNLPVNHPILQRLEWLGLFSDTPIKMESGSNLDILAKAMLERMSYKQGERDMIVLYHQFVVEYSGWQERIESTLIDYGEPEGDTAMAKTVSLPAAVAVKMLIEGGIKLTGVQIPVRRELYQPIMEELSKIGLRFQEQTQRLG